MVDSDPQQVNQPLEEFESLVNNPLPNRISRPSHLPPPGGSWYKLSLMS
jgi:hypothetical protein